MKLFRKKLSIVFLVLFAVLMLGIGLSGLALKNISALSTKSFNQELNYEDFAARQFEQSLERFREDIILDPFSLVKKSESEITRDPSVALYLVYPIKSETIGSLWIPALERELPIVEGTEEDDLKLGVGHFSGSVLPGENDNCVLSGHRDTVFTKLDKLVIGDELIVTTSAGTFIYEIKNIRIVDKDDRTVIVPTDHAVLTLTTCYPFHFIGNAPERYIVSADLITVFTKSTNED